MRVKSIGSLILAFLIAGWVVGLAGGQKIDEATRAWLEQVKVGPYLEPTLYELALTEREVTIYSYSSRVHQFGATFEARYPGIKVNAFDMDSGEILTKVLAEQRAGKFSADVIFLKDPAAVIAELYEPGYVFNYIPPDIKHLLPAEYREPLLVHHISLDVFIYNTEVYESSPIKNIWDLTRPEWQGKFLMPDPLVTTEYIEVLATIVQHAADMATAYEEAFGESLVLSPGVENAGYEWIKRVLQNGAVIVRSTDDVSNAVGAPGQVHPPVGLTAFSRLRDKEKNPQLAFDVAYGVKPVLGVEHQVVVAVVNRAPHPNAAKLLIQWMMGDDYGGWGYAPYHVFGNWPTRVDVLAPSGVPALAELAYWNTDAEFVWDEYGKIVDFWTLNR
ncbi:MAG: ABC transporter substrate-binding protein [Candidatus Bipolaricaulis sp.]|nr:ABC transporter substrate-binding protein [Candidatus Bipolaricaulis sp.]